MAEVKQRCVDVLGAPPWRVKLFDGWDLLRRGVAVLVPSAHWWLWDCSISNHPEPMFGEHETMQALVMLPVADVPQEQHQVAMLVDFIRSAHNRHGVDLTHVLEYPPGHPGNIETRDVLEGKWRGRAGMNAPPHHAGHGSGWFRGGEAMRPPRPLARIQLDLATALEYRKRHHCRPAIDQWVQIMRDDYDCEIRALEADLAEALSGDLEVSLSGTHVQDHTITVPYLSRVLEALQASCRTIGKSLSSDRPRRADTTLCLAGTGPGSFKVTLKTPSMQLDLIEEPLVDRAMAVIVDLLNQAAVGTIADAGPSWAATAGEPAVRAMIRFSSALAGPEVPLISACAPLAPASKSCRLPQMQPGPCRWLWPGQSGREILTVVGRLSMAQDRP